MTITVPVPNQTHTAKCELAAEVLRSTGTVRLQVTGWSMLPAVWPGDTLTIERVDAAALSEGDIVLVGSDHRFVAHRLVSKNNATETAVTRGDAMEAADPQIDHDQILGRVAVILRNGKAIEPRRTLRVSERAVAAMVRKSDVAARVVVGVHGFRRRSQV